MAENRISVCPAVHTHLLVHVRTSPVFGLCFLLQHDWIVSQADNEAEMAVELNKVFSSG